MTLSPLTQQISIPTPNVVIQIQHTFESNTPDTSSATIKSSSEEIVAEPTTAKLESTIDAPSSRVGKARILSNPESVTLSVEEIEAKRIQAILVDLTGDEVDRVIKAINAAKFSQEEIAAEVHLVSTCENGTLNCHLSCDKDPSVEILANGEPTGHRTQTELLENKSTRPGKRGTVTANASEQQSNLGARGKSQPRIGMKESVKNHKEAQMPEAQRTNHGASKLEVEGMHGPTSYEKHWCARIPRLKRE